jgi:hypothetical protein
MHFGCIGGLVLILVVVVGALLGIYYARKMFNDFTDAGPIPVPQVRLSQAQTEPLAQRVEAFRQGLETGKPTGPLTFNVAELNVLIATDPALVAFKNRFYFTISGNELNGHVSLPMEALGLSIFQGRYFNGTGTFSVALQNGSVRLNAVSLFTKGKPILDVYLNEIRKHNLAENINNQPRLAAMLARLQLIVVKDGKLLVVPKNLPRAQAPAQ